MLSGWVAGVAEWLAGCSKWLAGCSNLYGKKRAYVIPSLGQDGPAAE